MNVDTFNHKPRKWLLPYYVGANLQLIRQASYLLDMASPISCYEAAYDVDYRDVRESVSNDRSLLYRTDMKHHFDDFQLANHLYARGLQVVDRVRSQDLLFLRSLLIDSLDGWHRLYIPKPIFKYDKFLVGADMSTIKDFYGLLMGIREVELSKPYAIVKRRRMA